MREIIETETYFDGAAYHPGGPWLITLDNGVVQAISHKAKFDDAALSQERNTAQYTKVSFAMPGLVESHAHLFLNGGERDTAARSSYLKQDRDQLVARGRQNLNDSFAAGITLIRDAGDKHGINHQLRDETTSGVVPNIRSAGRGIRRKGRYGSLLAYEADTEDDILRVIQTIADEGADDLKIFLTGIIDFQNSLVKGIPQFDGALLSKMVAHAENLGLPTFAHCSGQDGLKAAVEGRVGSIEHGFFMSEDILKRMADQGQIWVPTFAPVHFQWANPEYIAWDQAALDGMRGILDQHARMLCRAHEIGVTIVAGSDCGSHGVPHGTGLIDEMLLMSQAGLPMEAVLAAATSKPRQAWGGGSALLAQNAAVAIALFDANPFENPEHLRRCTDVRLSARDFGQS